MVKHVGPKSDRRAVGEPGAGRRFDRLGWAHRVAKGIEVMEAHYSVLVKRHAPQPRRKPATLHHQRINLGKPCRVFQKQTRDYPSGQAVLRVGMIASVDRDDGLSLLRREREAHKRPGGHKPQLAARC